MDVITLIAATAQITATAQLTATNQISATATILVNQPQAQTGALTSANIIAVAAILFAFLGTIATLFASYKTNQNNNRTRLLENEANIIAKRREIVFTERIKALGEVVSKFSQLKLVVRDVLINLGHDNVGFANLAISHTKEIYDGFVELYHNKRMYMPKDIDKLIIDYSEQSRQYIPLDRDPVQINEFHDITRDVEAKIIAAIQQLSSFQ